MRNLAILLIFISSLTAGLPCANAAPSALWDRDDYLLIRFNEEIQYAPKGGKQEQAKGDPPKKIFFQNHVYVIPPKMAYPRPRDFVGLDTQEKVYERMRRLDDYDVELRGVARGIIKPLSDDPPGKALSEDVKTLFTLQPTSVGNVRLSIHLDNLWIARLESTDEPETPVMSCSVRDEGIAQTPTPDGQSSQAKPGDTARGTYDPVRWHFVEFRTRLDELEQRGELLPGGAELIAARLAELIPANINDVLFYAYGMGPYLGNSVGPMRVDLQPGMRLRVHYANLHAWGDYTARAQKAPEPPKAEVPAGEAGRASDPTTAAGEIDYGYVGGGSATYPIGRDPSDRSLTFDSFLGRVGLRLDLSSDGKDGSAPKPLCSYNLVAGVLEFHVTQFRRRLFRLYYPTHFRKSSIPEDNYLTLGGRVILIGAARYEDLDLKPQPVGGNGIQPIGFAFRGRATVTPEIKVVIQGESVWVPLGTTLSDVLQQTENWTDAEARGRVLFSRKFNAGPHNIRIKSDQAAFEIPLLKGDVVKW